MRSRLITILLLLLIACTCWLLYAKMQKSLAAQHEKLKEAGVEIPSDQPY